MNQHSEFSGSFIFSYSHYETLGISIDCECKAIDRSFFTRYVYRPYLYLLITVQPIIVWRVWFIQSTFINMSLAYKSQRHGCEP